MDTLKALLAGRSLYWLSKESGIAYSTCWRIMHGKVEPTLATLRKFAEALQCNVADLIERKTSKKRTK